MQIISLVREKGHNTIDVSAYTQYLATARARMPADVLAYVDAPWHYDFQHAWCPHDANLQSLVIDGGSLPEESPPRRSESLQLRLLGSRRDGVLCFSYIDVTRISLDATADQSNLGDLLVDEVRLTDELSVVHELAFEHGTLIIEAATFTHTWEPK